MIYLVFCAINFHFTNRDSVLADRFFQIPQDVIVPGILEVTDIGEIVASISLRPVLLEKLVNGLNKKAPLSTMEKECGTGESNVILREDTGNPSLAVWLYRQCLHITGK